MDIIDGQAISKQILEELKSEVSQVGATPTVMFIRVGEDPASVSYVKKKQKTAAELGIESRLKVLDEGISEAELLAIIDDANNDASVHGILVQAPLPSHISERTVFNRVVSHKDVDGFGRVNLGKLCQEDDLAFEACTPAGVVELLKRSNVETEGKHVVILGRSLIVGKPLSLLLSANRKGGNATVTVCHSRTRNLPTLLKSADIVVAAIGSPRFVTGDMLSEGAVVIDVGINRVEDASKKSGYRLVGDVDFETASKKASQITPVPGGVGPMTVAMLMRNTLKACKVATA